MDDSALKVVSPVEKVTNRRSRRSSGDTWSCSRTPKVQTPDYSRTVILPVFLLMFTPPKAWAEWKAVCRLFGTCSCDPISSCCHGEKTAGQFRAAGIAAPSSSTCNRNRAKKIIEKCLHQLLQRGDRSGLDLPKVCYSENCLSLERLASQESTGCSRGLRGSMHVQERWRYPGL